MKEEKQFLDQNTEKNEIKSQVIEKKEKKKIVVRATANACLRCD